MRTTLLIVGLIVFAGLILLECRYRRRLPSTGAGIAMKMLIKEMLYEEATHLWKPGERVVIFVDYGDGQDPFYRDGQDPPQLVLDRLARPGWAVKPVSQARVDEHGSVWDRETGSEAWVLRARIVRWLSREAVDAVQVEYGAWRASEAGWLVRGVVRWVPPERLEFHDGSGQLLREGPGGGKWVLDATEMDHY